MLIKQAADIRASEVTPESIYRERRRFMQGTLGLASGAALLGGAGLIAAPPVRALATDPNADGASLDDVQESEFSSDEELTSWEDVTRYNNFYEFGTDKGDPKRHSRRFQPRPWQVSFSGECEAPGELDLDDVLEPHRLEERIYRLRCVEAWSMVIPWVGVPLAPVLERFRPTSRAKYVAFTSVLRPDEMPGQKRSFIDWPYVEGLRIDEAMHPLTLLTVGLYGRVLPNQNGAPIRLVVPWKYGFKSIKSVVSIAFTEHEPPTTWNIQSSREYGFYSNVNPTVDHPRWSQKRERRIGSFSKRDTLMFNGYGEQVAHLYEGMDLAKYY